MQQSHFTQWLSKRLNENELTLVIEYLEPNGDTFTLKTVENLPQGVTAGYFQNYLVPKLETLAVFYDTVQEEQEYGDISLFT